MYVTIISPPYLMRVNKRQRIYQLLLLDHEDTRVGLKIDPFGLLDDLKTSDGDVFLIGETETDEV